MGASNRTLFGARAMLAISVAALAGLSAAQEPKADLALEPGVDTSAIPADTADAGPAADDVTEASRGSEREALEPGAASQVLAADVIREQSDGAVMDRMQLGRTEITGNQELPKVLYIVPWKKSDPGQLMGRPVNTLLDEVLAPVDREEFIRQVEYHGDLHGENQ